MTIAKARMVGGLVVITLLISFGVTQLLPSLPPLVYSSLSLLLFGLLVWAVDRRLWRSPLLHTLGLVENPYLGGEWLGKLITTYDDQSNITDIRVMIVQRWTSLHVHFFSFNVDSTSLSASIFRDPAGEYVLTYVYRTQPHETAPASNQPHIGLAVLRLSDSGQLSGYYHYFHTQAEHTEFIRGQLVLTRRPNGLVPEATL